MVYSSKLAEQYAKLKAKAGASSVLLMQVGSFMQVQGEDARAVSAVTGLKLQMAGDVDTPVVLGGFPKSGLDAYVGRLVRAGKSVAIALQDENKERRLAEVVRVACGKDAGKPAREDAPKTAREDARPPWTRCCQMEGERPREPGSGEVRRMSQTLPQRKRPVHMPPVERHNEPVILFVTIGTQPRVAAFANEPFHGAFVSACGEADAWTVGKYMIMPDHLHLFCGPARWPRIGIKRWAAYLKRRITIRLTDALENGSRGRSPSMDAVLPDGGRASPRASMGAVLPDAGRASPRAESAATTLAWKWQSDCWDTQIRSGEHYGEKWEYVRQNPVRKELVEKCEDWPWQGELNVLRW
jgi:putative transposase